jgi:ribosomal protein L19E
MEEELFAVATMLFMILITGQFPYARAGSDGDIARLVQEGNFAFQYKENSNRDQPDGNWKYMWSHLQPGIKGMFWNTFHRDGDRYGRRPSAEEWLRAFREYKRWLASGTNFDPMSNDVYPTRFRAMAADTPIYECAQCKTSMVGRWHRNTETYSTPKLCHDCQQNRPKCQDCGKGAVLSEGRCRECDRQRKYGSCAGCGKEIRRDHLEGYAKPS